MSLLALIAAEEHDLAPMLMDPIWFAVIAGAVFALLALVTWSFRDVSNRHSHKTAPSSHGSTAPHGTDHH